jgi:alkanesulfonate monooxygenase SsuD/methylene tetrahydromethanopterin reductase-like flavin-dependent oxidoreductase (luciferase family)
VGKALKIMDHPVRERIPVYVASLGPKNVEMTAEVAEGWLPLYFWPDRATDVWGDALEAGLAKRRRTCPRSRW